MSRKIVIIGANRGIGLELVRAYKDNEDEVTAVCRKASPELKESGVNIVEGIDVTSDTTVEDLNSKVNLDSIDILIHNAGILEGDRFPEISLDSMRKHFEVNTLGPLKSVLALKGKLRDGSKVGLVSSRVGSIDDNSSSNNYSYRTSKTALNMIGKCLSIDLKDQGVAVALLHPGYVRTEMTGNNGLINPDEAAKGLFEQMEKLDLKSSGVFVHSSGEKLPW